MSSVRKEVLNSVCKVQALLRQGDESACNALEEMKSLLPDSTQVPCDETIRNHHQEAKSIFVSEYYTSVAECLIESFRTKWLQGGRRMHQLLADFFLLGDPESALTVLSHAVSSSAATESLKVYRCIALLEQLLKQNCLRRIFSNYCCLCVSNEGDGSNTVPTLCDRERILIQKTAPLVSAVSSLPDIVTARLKSHDDSDFFYPQNYVPFVAREMVSVLRLVHARLRDGQSCSVTVISSVLGKLAMTGHGKLLWKSLLTELEAVCIGDFLWQRVLQKVVSGVPDRCVEQVTTPLVFVASSRMTVKAVLGELPIVRERLCFTLTHKLLLVRYYDQPQMLQNLIGYLASLDSLRPTFLAAFKKLLSSWSDGSSLRHRPLEQTIYICRAIMIFVAYSSQNDACLVTRDLKDAVLQTLLGGMGNYLDSSVVQIRQAGMVVGESLSRLVHSDEKRLEFEVERNELVDSFRELLLIPSCEEPKPVHSQDQVGERLLENDSRNTSKDVVVKSGDDLGRKVTNPPETLDSDDDEDELTPYDSNPKSSKPAKRPFYLAQCLDGLLKSDSPEWFEQCLRHAEELIRNRPEVREVAVEMCKVLLNLEDQYSLPEFVLMRHKALVALCVSCPEPTSRYLTHEFYERNYNIRQRLDILDVLSSAARELSHPTSPSSEDTISDIDCPSNNKPDWSAIVQARIESKTRRFAKGPSRPSPTPVPNRFANVSGWFFYPLMSQFDTRDSCLDLLGCDHILLQRLLSTLGIVVFCAANSPNISPMARALIEFTWCFRYHVQPGVRRAVLGAVIMTVVTLPPFLLVSDLCLEVADLRAWLQEEVMPRDTDGECRSLAAQILMALQTKLKEEMQDANGN